MTFTDMIKKFIRKRDEKSEEMDIPRPIGESYLPEELERFKLPERPEITPIREPIEIGPKTLPPTVRETVPSVDTRPLDKTELILQKLETIDARLKLIEERMK